MTQDYRRHLSYFEQYNLFGDACDIPKGRICVVPAPDVVQFGIDLVTEEWKYETLKAITCYQENPSIENFAEMADGFVDTVYVLCQFARILGIPFDAVWNEVQHANMRKIAADGKIIKRADGKVLKPEGWTPPNVWQVCYQQWVIEQDNRRATWGIPIPLYSASAPQNIADDDNKEQ